MSEGNKKSGGSFRAQSDLTIVRNATQVEWLTVYFIHTMNDPWITALRWAQAHGFSAAEIRAAHSTAVMSAL